MKHKSRTLNINKKSKIIQISKINTIMDKVNYNIKNNNIIIIMIKNKKYMRLQCSQTDINRCMSNYINATKN